MTRDKVFLVYFPVSSQEAQVSCVASLWILPLLGDLQACSIVNHSAKGEVDWESFIPA